jgi:hypothetical protein
MLKSMQWIVGVSAIVLLLSLAATSYLSSPPPSHPNKQQSSAETRTEDQNKQEHTLGGFVRFMLPDAISIFTFWLVLATVGLGIIAIYQISFLSAENKSRRILPKLPKILPM